MTCYTPTAMTSVCFTRALLALSIGMLAIACNSEQSTCGDDVECPKLEAEWRAGDAQLSWDTGAEFEAKLEHEETTAPVVGGGAVFTPLDPSCRTDCEYALKSLYFELGRMHFVTDGGLTIDELRIGLDPESSLSLPDATGDYVIPSGSKTIGCATVGDALSTESVTKKAATLVIEPATQTFTFSGELSFQFGAMPNRECAHYELTLRGSVAASAPWEHNPALEDESDEE